MKYTGNFSNQSLTVEANTIREAYYLLIVKAIKTKPKNGIDYWSLKEIRQDGRVVAVVDSYIDKVQVKPPSIRKDTLSEVLFSPKKSKDNNSNDYSQKYKIIN